MLGSKPPNNDANGLFRATHSHNPTRYSHIMVLTPHFYAHIGAGLKVILPPVCKHTWFQTADPAIIKMMAGSTDPNYDMNKSSISEPKSSIHEEIIP